MECGLYLTSGKWRTLVLSPLSPKNLKTGSSVEDATAITPLAVTFSPVYPNSNNDRSAAPSLPLDDKDLPIHAEVGSKQARGEQVDPNLASDLTLQRSSVAIKVASLSSAEQSSLRPLLGKPIYGSLGLIRLQDNDYLSIITEVARVGILQEKTIYRIKRVLFVSLNDSRFDDILGQRSEDIDETGSFVSFDDAGSTRPVGSSSSSVGMLGEACPWAKLATYLSSGSFYFSIGWDITQSLQRSSGGLDWNRAETSFFWNRFMMDPILNLRPQLPRASQAFLQDSAIFLVAMQGSVQIWDESTTTTTAPLFEPTNPSEQQTASSMTIAIISRLSCKRAGTRFLSRGIDDDGNVSNFVESETIIVYGPTTFSYVVIRGSVPVFWDQQGQKIGYPKLQLTRTPVATQPAFDRHITALNNVYGLVHSIDLLSQKDGQSEKMLASAHEFHAKRFPDRNVLNFTSFDMQAIVRYFDYDRLEGLFRLISRDLQVFGYYAKTVDMPSADKCQKGVFRVNCLDCLDRTNVAQSFIVRKVVDLFVRSHLLGSGSFKMTSVDATRLQQLFGELWATNGDQLSFIYAGSAAQKSSLTKTGKYTFSNLMEDVKKSVQRLYVNSFKDKGRQEAIDLLLGKMAGQQSVMVYDLVGQRLRAIMKERTKELAEWSNVRVQCLTWNTNGVLPTSPEEYTNLFKLPDDAPFPDILAVGFQEIVSLNATQIMSFDPERRLVWEGIILRILNILYGPDQYSLLSSHQLVGVALSVFVRTSAIQYVRNVENGSKKTGMGGIVGNKGSVSVRLDYLDSTFCFLASHLAAGQNNSSYRDRDWQAICSELQFSRGLEVLSHDNVFWFGDFNYRVQMDNLAARQKIEEGLWQSLLEYDQLLPRMAAGIVFVGFQEAPITFPPTYKFDLGTNVYDTSEKMRVPSWCDRILYKTASAINCLVYKSVPIDDSDHKPVTGLYEVLVYKIDVERLRQIESLEYHRLTSLIDFEMSDVESKAAVKPPLPPRPYANKP